MKNTPKEKPAASKAKKAVSSSKQATPVAKVTVAEKKKTPVKATVKDKQSVPEDKQAVIEKFAQRKGDTGSPEVQVALLTHKIFNLSSHLGENKKDNHSRRGLLKVVAKRRRILNYLLKIDEKRYKKLIGELSLKK